jgi:predicted secreted hydrolase
MKVKPIFFAVTPEDLTRDGLSESIAPWEDGLRIDTGPGAFEWWYYDAHFEDGSTAVIVYATKPLIERNSPLKPFASLTITRPDGTRALGETFFPAEQFKSAKAGCDVRIGPNWTRGDLHRYEVYFESDIFGAELTFTGIVPAWRPGAGKAYYGDREHFFGWLPAIPYGTVEGTLTYDGQVHSVKGTGYHDHNWGNVGLNEVMDHWYWGRAHIGEYTLIFVDQIAANAYGNVHMPVFLLAKGDQIITGNGAPFSMQTRDFVPHSGGRSYPREVDFDWKSGDEAIHLRLRKPKLIEARSLLLMLPKWQQRLARVISNPYYLRFNAELELEIALKTLTGRETGQALYEIMILQGKKHP